jgi:hypothetical protein
MSITIKTLQEQSAKENKLNAIYQTNDIVITKFNILFLDRLRKMQYKNVPKITVNVPRNMQEKQPYEKPSRKRFIDEYNQIKADFQKEINELKADKNKLNYEAGFKLQKMLNEWSGGTPKITYGFISGLNDEKRRDTVLFDMWDKRHEKGSESQSIRIETNGFPYTAMNNFYYIKGTPNIEDVINTYNNVYPESNVNNIQNYNDQLANEISEIVHKKESLRNTADYPKWQAINAGNPPSASDVPPPPPSYMAKIGTVKLSKLQIGMLAAGALLLATSMYLLIKK